MRGRRGDYQLSLYYLDEALSFIASERAWYAVQRDCGVGRRTEHGGRSRRRGGGRGRKLCLRRLPPKAARGKKIDEDSLFSSYPLDFSPFSAHTRHITSLPPAPHAAASPTISHHSSNARPSFALPTLHPTTAMRTIIPAFDPCMPQLIPLTHKLPNVPGGLIRGIWERAHQSGDALF
jgi:hypothetical protein